MTDPIRAIHPDSNGSGLYSYNNGASRLSAEAPNPWYVEDGLDSDRFEILSLLGSGGMGVVYSAYDKVGGFAVALKVAAWNDSDGCDSVLQTSLLREADIMERLDHPNIPAKIDSGFLKNGTAFLAMTLIEGISLHVACKSDNESDASSHESPMAAQRLKTLLDSFPDLCHAMNHAHHQGILHYDLKPGNIMLSEGRAWVIDWGFARECYPSNGRLLEEKADGRLEGTAAYVSPEQANRDLKSVGGHTDVFGLGTVLYYALTKESPNQGGSTLQCLINAQLHEYQRLDERVPPNKLAAQINNWPKLAKVVNRAIAPDFRNRYANCQQLSEAFEEVGFSNGFGGRNRI